MPKVDFKNIKNYISSIVLPGFDGLKLGTIISFFNEGLKNGVLHLRASSVTYNTFMAIPPTIIFLFTLIPYIPIQNFDLQLMDILHTLLPENSYKALESTLYEVITRRKGGLLSFGFALSFYFSTNGMHNLIVSFDATAHDTKKRKWLIIRLYAFIMVLVQVTLIAVAVIMMLYGKSVMDYMVENEYLRRNLTFYLINFSKGFVVILLFFSAISALYKMAPVKNDKWKFFSAGATFATLLSLAISFAFTYFVNHFNQWNRLYGSIGTLMASILWIYLNCYVLILGFELNASIKSAKKSFVNNS